MLEMEKEWNFYGTCRRVVFKFSQLYSLDVVNHFEMSDPQVINFWSESSKVTKWITPTIGVSFILILKSFPFASCNWNFMAMWALHFIKMCGSAVMKYN